MSIIEFIEVVRKNEKSVGSARIFERYYKDMKIEDAKYYYHKMCGFIMGACAFGIIDEDTERKLCDLLFEEYMEVEN